MGSGNAKQLRGNGMEGTCEEDQQVSPEEPVGEITGQPLCVMLRSLAFKVNEEPLQMFKLGSDTIRVLYKGHLTEMGE